MEKNRGGLKEERHACTRYTKLAWLAIGSDNERTAINVRPINTLHQACGVRMLISKN